MRCARAGRAPCPTGRRGCRARARWPRPVRHLPGRERRLAADHQHRSLAPCSSRAARPRRRAPVGRGRRRPDAAIRGRCALRSARRRAEVARRGRAAARRRGSPFAALPPLRPVPAAHDLLAGRAGPPGTPRTPGPGTPARATRNACSTTGPRSRTRVTASPTSVRRDISAIWSMSCSEPRPLSIVAVAPPSSTTGDCAICAFLTAVMVLVTPGPAVTAATPGMPVRRATASAAKTA